MTGRTPGRGDGADRLRRLLRGASFPGDPSGDPSDEPADGVGGTRPGDAAAGTGRRRHADPGPPPRPGWRLGGVPTAAAVGALLVSVLVAVLLLGGPDVGRGEEVVPPLAAGTSSLPGPGSPAVPGVSGSAPVGGPGPATSSTGPGAPVGGPAAGAAAGTAAGAAGPPAGPAAGAPAGAVPGAAAGRDADVGAPGPLVVHVDGAVVRPGVVEVPTGSRVADAVEAAGGVTEEADTRLVNLARLLVDGELVVVPVPGEVVPGAAGPPAAPGAAGTPGAAGAGAPGPATLLDLNAADTAALDALPGIGPVLAQRIVDHREQVGPFASVDDLDAVSGIGPSVMESLRDLVTV